MTPWALFFAIVEIYDPKILAKERVKTPIFHFLLSKSCFLMGGGHTCHAGMFLSGFRKRAVLKGRFWQTFRCTEVSSKKSFHAVLPWQKKAMIFVIPGPPKPEWVHIRQNCPFTKPPFCFLSILSSMVLDKCSGSLPCPDNNLGHEVGACKTYGGGTRTKQRPLQKKNRTPPKRGASGVSVPEKKKQSNDIWGERKAYQTKRGPRPFLGGVSFMRFSSPRSFQPPVGIL